MNKRLSPEKYTEECWEKVKYYVEGVSDGTIITNKWIKILIDWYKPNDKFEFRNKPVERVFKFFSLLNIDNDNEYTQFNLQPFQCFYLANIFGFFRRDNPNERRYKMSFLFMARKNGKTSFSSALQLYFLIADKQLAPQSLLIAAGLRQAGIALTDLQRIILNTPELGKRLKFNSGKVYLYNGNDIGFCQVVSGIGERNDGYKLCAAILDEVHTYEDDKRYNIVKKATSSRVNSLIMMITTAGFILDGFCTEMIDYSKKILLNEIHDDTMFPMLYCPDDEDEHYMDQSVWYKSNPGLGTIKKMNYMVNAAAEAINRPSSAYDFMTKDLNIFYGRNEQWLKDEYLIKACQKFNVERFKGKRCYVGIDLSSTTDLTAVVCMFFENDKFYVLPYYFISNEENKMIRSGNINIKNWIKEGHVIKCESKTIDFNVILEKIKEINMMYEIVCIGYDPYNGKFIIPKIMDLNIQTEEVRQSTLSLSEPLKFIERNIIEENLYLGDNPCQLWNWRNCVLYMDGNGNIKIMKNKSKDSVDGAVALNNAMAMYLKYEVGSGIAIF